MSTASRLPALILSSWLGLPLCSVPPLPPPPTLEAGCQRVDEKKFSKLGRSQEKPLDRPRGGGGADEMNRKRKKTKTKQKQTQTTELPTLTYLSQRRKSEARSRIMLSAGGVWGRQVGEGRQKRAQRQRRCEEASQVTTEKRAGWLTGQSRPGCWALGPGALADKSLLQVFSLKSVVGHVFPLPTLQLARHGF